MSESYDVIVAGLGAMGSAAAFHLARQRRKVLGLDRFKPPHSLGSSHGQTRIIREAYFEHPMYVPLVQRAYQLWAQLALESGRDLLRITGGLMIGPADGVLVCGARRSAEQHRLSHEVLTAEEVRSRFPVLRPADDMVAVWEPRAGVLFPEACIGAHLGLAQTHGATLHYGEPVVTWRSDGSGVTVTTAGGEYRADQLLLTAGSWITSLVPESKHAFTVERQVLYWFAPVADHRLFAATECPVHLWESSPRKFFYGFPDFGSGVKVAVHHGGEVADPDQLRREVSDDEVAAMRKLIRRFLPGADGALRSAEVCMYTNTQDENFWIDRHPDHPQVLIASPCSGHGFKFASVMGEVLAELLTTGRSRFDLTLFQRR